MFWAGDAGCSPSPLASVSSYCTPDISSGSPSSSSSKASANSSARLPSPFEFSESTALPNPFGKPQSPLRLRSWAEFGRGVRGEDIEYCDDLRLLIDGRFEWKPLLSGLGDVMELSRLKVDDLRRCIGVLGEVGMAGYFGPQPIVLLESQPANRHVSWWSTNSGVWFAGVAAGSATFPGCCVE